MQNNFEKVLENRLTIDTIFDTIMSQGGKAMKLKLMKQPKKYLASVDEATRKKLEKALEHLARFEGDIKPLKGFPHRYRYKIAHYRILFTWVKGEIIITVVEINTRTNIKY